MAIAETLLKKAMNDIFVDNKTTFEVINENKMAIAYIPQQLIFLVLRSLGVALTEITISRKYYFAYEKNNFYAMILHDKTKPLLYKICLEQINENYI